ncbi:AAA family ATPase [Campylobacter sp.]|uniref:AAA family ATPase n=1 Tax=Campylobacter sp. TaxID=205 RepID=UPI00259C7611|nr:AAA family ATPase [Campylobacter sp.]MBQ3166697.1 AAA family ATPase [Campylobacter sp.]
MIEQNLAKSIKQANDLALSESHEYISTEHILYTLTFDKEFIKILENIGINDVIALRNDLINILKESPKSSEKKPPILTHKLSELFSSITAEENFGIEEFLDEVLADKNSQAYQLFEFHGLNIDTNELLSVAVNLNELVKNGQIDPVINRDKEIDKALQILCRHKKNNPIFVGEAGVGKTAIVQGIAQRIVQGNVPARLKDSIIFSLDIFAILAGAKYRGEFEERLKEIINRLKENKNHIIFIDEIHTILNTGNNDNGQDAANILKPHLANGDIRCIGATTYSEFRNFNKDRALLRRFNKIDVAEPSKEESLEILKGLRATYEKFHNVKYSDEVLNQSIEMAKRYLSDKFLPDSAIDIIDEAGAATNIEHKKSVTKTKINEIVSKMANVSNIQTSSDNTQILKNLSHTLGSKIYGQDLAIKSLNDALITSYAGLNDENRPIGVFLFTGSSGVGKTELAKELANALNIHFERFDMSEYMEKHAVAKLIGAPPGYIGFENGGILTNMVKKHPYSVILFDEIEKAHPELLNIFLQIFDSATLSDASGNKSDFKNTIIIMSSNLGTKEAPIMGFNKNDSDKTDRAVKGFFAAEFRNRIDKIINFNSLSHDVLEKIVQKEIKALEISAKKVKITLSKKAVDELIKRGYSNEFGARNLKRTIKDNINLKLSKELLFGALKNGGTANIDFDKDEFKFDFNSAK